VAQQVGWSSIAVLTLLYFAQGALYFDTRNRGTLKFEAGSSTEESKKRPVGGALDNCF